MGLLDDMLKTLDRIPVWKRLGEVPAEIEDLKMRLAVLEGKLNGKWPAEVCRYCGERAARLSAQFGPNAKGGYIDQWTCNECQQSDERPYKPA